MKSYYDEKSKNMTRVYKLQPMVFSNTSPTVSITKDTKIEDIPELRPDNEIAESHFTTSFVAFSGADCIIKINDEVVGEIQSLSWYKPTELEKEQLNFSDYYDKELALRKPIILRVDIVIFNKTSIKELKDATIEITLANEYGIKITRKITGASTLRELGGMDIDDITLNNSYLLAANSMTDYE